MPRIQYVARNFRPAAMAVIDAANVILHEYEEQGFVLTLRQLYYQFVSRDLLPNVQESYDRLGSIINDARLAGLVDWNHLIDRTRNLQTLQHFAGAADALQKLASWYHIDMWERQQYRPEVWIEKDALVGVIEGVCQELDVPYFSCRGYTSQSEMWAAAMRFKKYEGRGQIPYIFHFGDHDPSGKDMSRDIADRIELFMGGIEFTRVALTMDQIEEYSPPPNPAKITDSRAKAYIAEYGNESWELDALEPTVIATLIRDHIAGVCDETIWAEDTANKRVIKRRLQTLANEWRDDDANQDS